jgi:hypothetical protein
MLDVNTRTKVILEFVKMNMPAKPESWEVVYLHEAGDFWRRIPSRRLSTWIHYRYKYGFVLNSECL